MNLSGTLGPPQRGSGSVWELRTTIPQQGAPMASKTAILRNPPAAGPMEYSPSLGSGSIYNIALRSASCRQPAPWVQTSDFRMFQGCLISGFLIQASESEVTCQESLRLQSQPLVSECLTVAMKSIQISWHLQALRSHENYSQLACQMTSFVTTNAKSRLLKWQESAS